MKMLPSTILRLALLTIGGVPSVLTVNDQDKAAPGRLTSSTQASGEPATQPHELSSAPEGTTSDSPHEIRLFGQSIYHDFPPPSSDPSPSTPPGWHIIFPPLNQPPVLDRRLADRISATTYRGRLSFVPGHVFNDPMDLAVRDRLVAWSKWALLESQDKVDYHFHQEGTDEAHLATYLYMYRFMSPDGFSYVFPHVEIDWSRVKPLVVFKTRVPRPDFLSYGKVEIAGVEMVIDMHHSPAASNFVSTQSVPEILRVVEKGPQLA
ncbi:uncharacterized protein MEPE_06102 [Melanopsichium pennsylvanicum]|uniref:Uncharacterized protein n=2 Tax=Melanopsichium pennsylvanicum TaxID=63383 RepID=A0AAJ5C7X3_9BASI|nr:uncharacterized protein BN887_02622 [Melanopsichium pennsylvanicum 4]SNX87392.1 uncharacterized protein MEPE_06102 [Melanopsichium pennsylvanicum]